jgi:hypothetical protein
MVTCALDVVVVAAAAVAAFIETVNVDGEEVSRKKSKTKIFKIGSKRMRDK